MTRLTDADRGTITRAAELAALHGTDAIRQRFAGWGDDTAAPYIEAFAHARYLLGELIDIIERLEEETS